MVITLNLAAKIYQEYGPKLYSIIKENPYKLADDIPGVGFKMADEIAEKVGIFTDSDYRIRAGLLYILLQGIKPTAIPIFLRKNYFPRRQNC